MVAEMVFRDARASSAGHPAPGGRVVAPGVPVAPGGRVATAAASLPRLLAGPALNGGAESLADHVARLGPRPSARGGAGLFAELDASGLLGRGGAGFPVGRKWRSVAERATGPGAVVLVNAAEGEPLSHKDRSLLLHRPHLVLDGAELAAEAVDADEIVFYVGEAHGAADAALAQAVQERASARASARRAAPARLRIVRAPDRYIAGEESAAVHFVNAGDARPITTPPRPYERGIGGHPTLIQNVESLAHVALIARHGADWYREAGRGETRGTMLVTVTSPGSGGRSRVHEIELGTTIGEVAQLAGLRGSSRGGSDEPQAQAVLLGGYFGRWLPAEAAWDLPLDPAALRPSGISVGAGVVAFLSARTCPVVATARIAEYMAAQSAAQCGPCVYGLRAIADAMARIAKRRGGSGDLANLNRWAGQVRNRGACRHPDGAVGLLVSALDTFGDELIRHQQAQACSFT